MIRLIIGISALLVITGAVHAEPVTSNADLTGVYATPCPFDLSQTMVSCTFIGIPEGSKIIIFDMAGRTVKELDSISWDGRNKSGDLVASGTYVYRVEAPDGSRFTGKLAVVK